MLSKVIEQQTLTGDLGRPLKGFLEVARTMEKDVEVLEKMMFGKVALAWGSDVGGLGNGLDGGVTDGNGEGKKEVKEPDMSNKAEPFGREQ